MKTKLTLFVCAMLTHSAYASPEDIQKIFNEHFDKHKQKEYFSGAAFSYSIPGHDIKNFYRGFISHEPNAAGITATTLFQIGSITKSFTGALLIKAEQTKRLSLNDSFVKWLPEYKNWPAEITVEQLLNMTSNLPSYTDAPLWNAQEADDLSKGWTQQALIAYVYPRKDNVPLRTGYFYSNTGYVLADLIFQKATNTSFDESIEKMVEDAGLSNTFYPLPVMTKDAQARLAHGYNYNPYDNPAMVGRDVYTNNMSWAGAAGAMLSTPEDIIKWVQYLFTDKDFLNSDQRKQLMSLHSTNTGKTINKANTDDSEGFGLGVAQMYKEGMGNFWFYEGITLGFRAIYMYQPCNGITIAATFNSTPDKQNDSSGKLIQQVYQQLLKDNPNLRCKHE